MAKEGTFLVAHADETAPVLRDVRDGQVLTLAGPPDLSDGPLREDEVIQGRVVPASALAVAWHLETVENRWTVTVSRPDEPPTALARELAADRDVGELARRERAGEGELHVLSVPADRTEQAADEVAAEAATVERAARLGVARVEVRAGEGVVSVRYLP